MTWLLELAADPAERPAVMEALATVVAGDSPQAIRQQTIAAVEQCAGIMPDTAERVPRVGTTAQGPSLETPKAFSPPVTEQGPVNRHPWEGVLTGVTVGEFATGSGRFLATAVAQGMRGEWMAEPDPEARELAMHNCPGVPTVFESIYQVDPVAIPWVHVLLGGACCQPFSRAGKQQGWHDERAYTTIRFMHNMGAMQPWMAVSENVRALLTVKGGRVWQVIKGSLQHLGYAVNPVKVCASR